MLRHQITPPASPFPEVPRRNLLQEVLEVLLLLVVTVATLHAQGQRSPVQLRAGAALALATTSVAGETATDLWPVISAVLGSAHRTSLSAEMAVQPFKAHNPVADEAFRALYALAGVQIRMGAARRVYLRPAVGLVVRSWSGTQVAVGTEVSPAVGMAVGAEFRLSRSLDLAPEGFVRVSGANELSTALFGLGVSVSRREQR